MVDLEFRNIFNSLFFLSFKNDENDRIRDFFSLIEIKYFNQLIYNQVTTYLLTLER